jgi:hypothetical protein
MGWGRWLLLGDLGQQLDIEELREHVEQIKSKHESTTWDVHKIKEVAHDLIELQLRHGLLVRLLIAKGLVSAEEYAGLISAARSKLGKGEEAELAAATDRPRDERLSIDAAAPAQGGG